MDSDLPIDIEVETTAALVVVAKLPQVPVVLVTSEAMAALEDLERSAAAVAKVTDDATSQAAWASLATATKMEKALESGRLEVSKPFREITDRINTAAKDVAARIAKAKATIKSGLNVYQAELDRKRREEEDRRRREAEALERQKREAEEKVRREQEEAARLAAEAAKRAEAANAPVIEVDDIDLDIPVAPSDAERKLAEIQAQQQALAKPVMAAPVKPAGAQWRVTLKPLVVDIARVPESLLKPREADMERIRGLYCTGYKDGDLLPNVPGLKFEVTRTPVIR